jgi:succinate dehydrogenase/fumarate reductase flavoprotein subunit
MTEEQKEKPVAPQKGVSRREFIAGTVGGVVVGAVVGAATGSLGFPRTVTKTQTETATQTTTQTATQTTTQTATQTTTQTTTSVTTAQPWLPAKWDYTADVVVVGFGGAGAVAATTAAKAGSKVILLEKMPEGLEGGNTGVSGGAIMLVTPVASSVAYLNAMADGYKIPQDLVQAWAQQMDQGLNWLKSVGGSPVPASYSAGSSTTPAFPYYPGADCVHVYHCPLDPTSAGAGKDFFAFLKSVVKQQSNITVMYSTPATSLIQNAATKEILGVTATANYPNPITGSATGASPSTINIKASKAVILTLGGFENNPQMFRDYAQTAVGGGAGTPGNTGDGITMATAVGAALWHMDNVSGSGFGVYVPALPNGPGLGVSMPANGYVYVGSDGNRFVNEKVAANHGKIPFNYTLYPNPAANTQWVPYPTPFPVHVVFDETTRKAGPIVGSSGYAGVHSLYTWSSDNSVEISKGWISQANTLQDLATAIGKDPTTLSAAISQYNGYCQSGVDAQFGRSKSTLVPIQTPPYYAVSLTYLVLNTQGGAKRNAKCQVVDFNNNPIKRLYGAGEFGSIYSWVYNGGGNNGESVATGPVAGTNAAAETPWS